MTASPPRVWESDGADRPSTVALSPSRMPRATRPSPTWTLPWPDLVAMGAVVAAVAAWFHATRSADLAEISNLGLITALPWTFFAAAILLACGFAASLHSGRRPAVRLVLIVAWTVLLHGTVAAVEPTPRFSTAWLHAGFSEHIARTGTVLPQLDARFNWPGFFSAIGMMTAAAGVDDPVVLLSWASTAANLLYLPLMYGLARAVTAENDVPWLAMWLFPVANWVGQDYFSPQAMAYLLMLAVLLITLRWFRSAPSLPVAPAGRLRAAARRIQRVWPDEPVPPDATPLSRGGLILLLAGLLAVLVVAHQLTPVALVLSLGALVLAARCRLVALPVLLGVLLAGWVSYGAVAYWSGHLQEMFGSLGRLGMAVEHNVVGRVEEADTALVLHARLALTAGVGVLAGAGFLRRWRAGYGDLSLVALAGAPLLLPIINAYGGEALMRAYFYALPFLAVFVAHLLPRACADRARLFRAIIVLVVSCSIVPAFVLARYGNERYEMVTSAEAEAFDVVYDNAPDSHVLVTVLRETPVQHRRVGDVSHEWVMDEEAADVGTDVLVERIEDVGPRAWVVLTRGQQEYGRLRLKLSPTWVDDIAGRLVDRRFRLVYENADAQVFRPVATGSAPVTASTGAGNPAETTGVVTGIGGLARALGVGLFLLLAPGLLIVWRLGVRDPWLLAALVPATSFAVAVTAAQLMLWTGWWQPHIAVMLLATVTVLGFLGPRVVGGSPRGLACTRAGGSDGNWLKDVG